MRVGINDFIFQNVSRTQTLSTENREASFWCSTMIAEFWNTISNFPFIIIGLIRLTESLDEPLWTLYVLFVLAGVASAIHHATETKWTIILDWIPIALSLGLGLYEGIYVYFSIVSWFKV